MSRPKNTKKNGIKYLTEEELKLLFREAKKESQRDLLLLKLSYVLGLRVSEAVQIKKDEVDLDLKTIKIRGKKGGKEKLYQLKAPEYKQIWSKLKAQLKKSKNDYLFSSNRRDNHITAQAAKNLFKKYLIKAGLRRELSIHSLRHSCGVTMAKSGLSPLMIQDWLRHKSTLSTRVYYEQAEFEHTASYMASIFQRV